MMKRDKVKILGTPRAMILRSKPERMAVRYDTMIYSNGADNEFIKKLARLDFGVIFFNQKYLRVLLPVGWSHMRISREAEIIVDTEGRVRVGIERKKKFSFLYRRYDFAIHLASTGEGNDKKYSVVTQITDAGEVIEEYPYDNGTLESVEFKKYAHTDEHVSEAFKLVMSNVLDGKYPNWRDETAYWED